MKKLPEVPSAHLLNRIVNIAKRLEELLYPSARLLSGFKRAMQNDPFSCGAQCVYMAMHYYGIEKEIGEVARGLKTDEDGTDQREIRAYLKKHGLQGIRINKPTVEKLRHALSSGWPVLLSIDEDHYVMAYGFDEKAIFLADPAWDRNLNCRKPLSKFERRWDVWAMRIIRSKDSCRTGAPTRSTPKVRKKASKSSSPKRKAKMHKGDKPRT